jgi:hypothetical protein
MKKAAIGLALSALLAACAGPQLADHAGQTPAMDFRQYFDGLVTAHGVVRNRGGKVLRRFVVTMDCSWTADGRGTLHEEFRFDDGERQQRTWQVQRTSDGRWRGTAADVVGQAEGETAGPAFNWRYTLRLPVDGSTYEVQFDDWMYRIDKRTVINTAEMRKFGVRVGEVVLSFTRP